jgi:hypothetical protein
MAYDEQVDDVREIPCFGHIAKVGKPSMVVVPHVHATIEHNVFSSCKKKNTIRN